MKYGSESSGMLNIDLRVQMCGIWLCEWVCVEYWSESGGVEYSCGWRCLEYGSEGGGVWNDSEIGGEWNMALRVEVSGIWL